ncbi:acyl carrier protein [Candidatus Pacearchaeota archaeon]|nr:hypothetical protein [uncultured archaeon]MBS3066947.1 acyl carrier protein [Candidatus Pacearchaeota archaeon]
MNFSDMGSVEREIKQTIADCLKVELSSLKDENTFYSLGIESLTFIEIALCLDDKYSFGDEDIRALRTEAVLDRKQLFEYLTVGKFVDYITSKYGREVLAHT